MESKQIDVIWFNPMNLVSIGSMEIPDLANIDPMYRSYGINSELIERLEKRLIHLKNDRKASFEKIIETFSDYRGLKEYAWRRDWPYVYKSVSQVLVMIAWTKKLFGGPDATIAQEFKMLEGQSDLNALALSTMEMIKSTLDWIHIQQDGLKSGPEEWFNEEYFNRNNPVSLWNIGAYENIIKKVAVGLEAMPVFQGLLVVGSYAEKEKHDGKNDLDLYCYCTEVPDVAMRNSFFSCIKQDQKGGTIAFEYMNINGAHVHMCFVTIRNQIKAIGRLKRTGDESSMLTFNHPEFAASGYQLTRGRIISDPNGHLKTFKEGLRDHPSALRDFILSTWEPVRSRLYGRFNDALRRQDGINAFIAAGFGSEAALRIIFAKKGVYCNSTTPKWFHKEIGRIAPELSKYAEPLENRFSKLSLRAERLDKELKIRNMKTQR